ncbi:nucleotidyltransferase family protein, partial [Rhodoblastus sp.]|uniref:nucleotidyltransferase family protein n=1 Tax=Rhodoblastus sp. TaxID=1962975 RepID=UPI003F988DEC
MSARPQKALVFAAGLGTRMRPITLTVPKPLVRVGGRTMLDHMLDRLDEAGIEEVIVNVHWLADQVEDHLQGRTAPRIKISDERDELLDQGGGIVKVLGEFHGKPFFICNTDALWINETEPQVARLARAWDGAKMDVLLLLAEIETSIGVERGGDFCRDAQGRLRRPAPNEAAPYVESGVGVIKSSLFADRPLEPFRLAPFFFAAA